jgi:glycopeptide antibiotics resistance protein
MKKVLKVLYVIYFIVLLALVTCKVFYVQVYGGGIRILWADFMRNVHEISQSRLSGYWNYNFKPFNAYRGWHHLGMYYTIVQNLLGNIVAFIPMGFFEMALSKHRKLWKVVLKCAIVVTSLELFQFLTCLGYLDIDDITMNTFGCLLGCLSFYLLAVICRKAKTFLLKKKINF